MVEVYDVFGAESFFLLNTPLRILRQGIRNSICLILVIINLKELIRKFLSVADLFGAQTLYFKKLFEVIIIGKHKNFMLRTF